jgi:hypothetical protein
MHWFLQRLPFKRAPNESPAVKNIRVSLWGLNLSESLVSMHAFHLKFCRQCFRLDLGQIGKQFPTNWAAGHHRKSEALQLKVLHDL